MTDSTEQVSATQNKTVLQLLPYESEMLRSRAADVPFPLSAEDETLISNMLHSIEPEQLAKVNAPWPSAVGMAATQWGVHKRIFLWARSCLASSPSHPDLHKSTSVLGSKGYVVAINPEYRGLPPSNKTNSSTVERTAQPNDQDDDEDQGAGIARETILTGLGDTVLGWEGCFSVPGMRGKVRRHHRIEAIFQTVAPRGHTTEEAGAEGQPERHCIVLEGWPARVFQHECDHTEGRLYDDPRAGRCSCRLSVNDFQKKQREDVDAGSDLCAACGKSLTGGFVELQGEEFHDSCAIELLRTK